MENLTPIEKVFLSLNIKARLHHATRNTDKCGKIMVLEAKRALNRRIDPNFSKFAQKYSSLKLMNISNL